MTTLIGHTGFVGTTLRSQTGFDHHVNRANLSTLAGHTTDLVVCAAAPAAKWVANQDPDEDRRNLGTLITALGGLTTERFVLISTVDVYPEPVDVDESTDVDNSDHHAYGRHRRLLERAVHERFPEALIVRLPALFGPGLRKNFVYDLHLERDEVALTHADSRFQFYDMSRLWTDLQRLLATDLKLVNLTTEPVRAGDVAEVAYGRSHDLRDAAVVSYNVRSIHADELGGAGGYVQSATQVLAGLRRFATLGPEAVA